VITFIDTLDHKEGTFFFNSINSLKNNNNKSSSPISMGGWVDQIQVIVLREWNKYDVEKCSSDLFVIFYQGI
jgi:hypothetical protein